MSGISSNNRLLVFDCHEAWVYQLHAVDREIDVVVGLPGRSTTGWDFSMRPLPPNARCIELEEIVTSRELYYCIVAHSLSDLLDVKSLEGPRLLVIHATLGGMIVDQQSVTPLDELRRTMSQYVRMIGAHVMPVSHLKGRSWGFDEDDEDIVPFFADLSDYIPYRGDLPCGLRVANQIRRKARTLKWDFHEQAFAGMPIALVGRNDDIPGVAPARDWNHLKETLSRHRFVIHTADPALEDGYNMATLEAMAAGLPVLGNRHPTSPILNGVSGFLSDDPAELRACAWRLLNDRELAARMGREAQKTVAKTFTIEKFKSGLIRAIETARMKWLTSYNVRTSNYIQM